MVHPDGCRTTRSIVKGLEQFVTGHNLAGAVRRVSDGAEHFGPPGLHPPLVAALGTLTTGLVANLVASHRRLAIGDFLPLA